MSIYGDDLADLARPLAELLALGSGSQAPTPVDTTRVVAARDTVLSATRTALDAVSSAGPGRPRSQPGLAGVDPVRALRAALHDVDGAAPDVAPSEVHALRHDVVPDGLWRSAASTALALTGHEQGLRRLPGPAAWTVASDLAARATAVCSWTRTWPEDSPPVASRDERTTCSPTRCATARSGSPPPSSAG